MGKQQYTNNSYSEGAVIFAKERPILPLVIRRYLDQIYYCTNQNNPKEKERVCFERQLIAPKI
ncbi:MAG: hypothetical protein RIF33_25225 [Cyclobacteriaceae bacterium]